MPVALSAPPMTGAPERSCAGSYRIRPAASITAPPQGQDSHRRKEGPPAPAAAFLPLGQLPVERFQLGGQVPALFRLLLAEKIIHRRVQRPGDADKHPGIGHRQSRFP